ncbi:MAG: hypothetical protein R3249_09535 [Nitriliruptorales bacterium]|nr:hypothetical protein [Nitriliruptorales bacterium]
MATSVLLVHSPLVGPGMGTRAADLLREHGHEVALPDLTFVASAPSPMWRAFVTGASAAGTQLSGAVAVVGHSGAGAFLPAVGERLSDRRVSLLFVDAVIPPASGAHETSERLRALLDAQTVGGELRRWLHWWPDEVAAELLPDEEERAELLSEMPVLPRSFHDESVPVPADWTDLDCAYLQLSQAYDAEYEEAGRRGWPRFRVDANHLAIRTQPDIVVSAIESLLDLRS